MRLYKKIVAPLIIGLLTITTGCSNIPASSSISNIAINTAQSVSLSSLNNENDLSKVFNSEYKRFSTKDASNGIESIALSNNTVDIFMLKFRNKYISVQI